MSRTNSVLDNNLKLKQIFPNCFPTKEERQKILCKNDISHPSKTPTDEQQKQICKGC